MHHCDSSRTGWLWWFMSSRKKKDLIRTRQVTMEKHNSDKCVKPNRSSHDQSSDGVGDKHSLYCHQVIMNPCALGFSDTIFCFSQKRKMSVLAVRSPCIQTPCSDYRSTHILYLQEEVELVCFNYFMWNSVKLVPSSGSWALVMRWDD